MISARLQMALLSWGVCAITVAGLLYIAIAPPAYLLKSRYGVPHLTPTVHDPQSGKEIPVDALVRSYMGESGQGKVYY